jgi:hypothetical protein
MTKYLNIYFRQHYGFVAGKRLHDSREAAQEVLRTVRNDTRPLGVIEVTVPDEIVALAYPAVPQDTTADGVNDGGPHLDGMDSDAP